MYSNLSDALSSSDALEFPNGVPGQRGKQKSEIGTLWLNHQIEQRSIITKPTMNNNEYTSLRKENQRLRSRLFSAEERIKTLESLLRQNRIDIPAQETKRNRDSGSVSSIASTVVVSSSSTPKISNLSKSETMKSKATAKRSQSFSHDSTPATTPPSTPPRLDDDKREVKVRFLLDGNDKYPIGKSNLNTRSRVAQTSQARSSYSDDTGESSIDLPDIPKLSRITSLSIFDIAVESNESPFRSCMRSFITPKNRIEKSRSLSISSYDDVFSSSKVQDKSLKARGSSSLKKSSYQGSDYSYSSSGNYNIRINGNIDRAEI